MSLTQTVIEGSKGKVTAMMFLGMHIEVFLSHTQNTLLALQGEKGKWKAEINMS